jgi:leucyl-tRNA synthetase
LNRVYHFQDKLDKGEGYHASIEPLIHKTIKEVGNDIEQMKFNTAISKLMILSNAYAELDSIHQVEYEVLIKLLNPFAPHICEELNQKLGHKECLVHAPWPSYDESKTIDNEVEIGVQVNGKFRGTIVVKKDANPKEMEQAALALTSVQAQIKDKTVRKVICIPNKIVNIVAN